MNHPGPLVARLRQARGLKQQELADRVGVDQRTISHIEKMRRKPSIKLAIQLANEFGISLDELLGKDETEPEAVAQ